MGWLRHKQASCQLNYHEWYRSVAPHEIVEQQRRRWKIKLFTKEMVECLHLIFWPGRQKRVPCHTTKLELNQTVRIYWVPLLEQCNDSTERTYRK
jgi:hypothetical protein